MKKVLAASHLLKHILIFVLTVVFLLTMVRAAYGLWQFAKLDEADAVVPLFIQGLRFDLALVGLICIIPVVLGSLLSMTHVTRGIAKFIVSSFLIIGLLFVLCMELITPWFIQTAGVRPDFALLGNTEDPIQLVTNVAKTYPVPLAIGVILCILIMIAFWVRLDLAYFLRSRVAVPSALLLAVFGGAICLVAIWSTPDLRKPAFSPGDALISTDNTVNDLTMNTAYKALYSLALPYFNQSSDAL